MKIITMKRLTLDKEPLADDDYTQCDPNDWFCVIETKEEEMVYEAYIQDIHTYSKIWNEMVRHAGLGIGLSWGDDDVYGYIRPDETEPEVGEEWDDWDGDKWVRVE